MPKANGTNGKTTNTKINLPTPPRQPYLCTAQRTHETISKMYNGNMIISMSVTRPESFLERAAVVIGEFASEVLIRTNWRGIKQFFWQAA
jgi:hypothetical protein